MRASATTTKTTADPSITNNGIRRKRNKRRRRIGQQPLAARMPLLLLLPLVVVVVLLLSSSTSSLQHLQVALSFPLLQQQLRRPSRQQQKAFTTTTSTSTTTTSSLWSMLSAMKEEDDESSNTTITNDGDSTKKKNDDDDDRKETTTNDNNSNNNDLVALPKRNVGLKRLAELSLQDYQWRSDVWKQQQADRQVEASLARMMGVDTEGSSSTSSGSYYVRPMDASSSSIGPLGQWEKASVEWLAQVFEEEARRAEQIVKLGGILVRPMDQTIQTTPTTTTTTTTMNDGSQDTENDKERQLGPLGRLEWRVVNFLESIRQSERERVFSQKYSLLTRPKDLDETKRGPLGNAEYKASRALQDFFQSERIRVQLSKVQDNIVRPIDVPGPLGEFEMAVLQIIRAEEQRKRQYERRIQTDLPYRPSTRYRPIRPMEADLPGPLGELEQQATLFVQKLTQEEKQRLRNIQKYLEWNRSLQQLGPTNSSPNSVVVVWGVLESIVVGILRAPILLYQIGIRVRTLLESEPLDDVDAEILLQRSKEVQARQATKSENNSGDGGDNDDDDDAADGMRSINRT